MDSSFNRPGGLAGLSVQQTAIKIGRSTGWVSEVENNSGRSRLSEVEFNRIVEILDGTKHRAMFRTWVANFKNRERLDKTFDGAVLKHIRTKKELSLKLAAKASKLSAAQLSKIETGLKPVSYELRNRIMAAYGYSASSWKNLATDPVRSKAVPNSYKLEILLNRLPESLIEKVFDYTQGLWDQSHEQ
jgi:transcriptional regulator with XRE-family HTH domain